MVCSGRLVMGKPLLHLSAPPSLSSLSSSLSPSLLRCGERTGEEKVRGREPITMLLELSAEYLPLWNSFHLPGPMLSAGCAVSQVTSLGDVCAHQTKVKASRIQNSFPHSNPNPASVATVSLILTPLLCRAFAQTREDCTMGTWLMGHCGFHGPYSPRNSARQLPSIEF